jgi:hypothetical protein
MSRLTKLLGLLMAWGCLIWVVLPVVSVFQWFFYWQMGSVLPCNRDLGTVVFLAPPRNSGSGANHSVHGTTRFCLLRRAIQSVGEHFSTHQCAYPIHVLLPSDPEQGDAESDGIYTEADRALLRADGLPSEVIFVSIPMYSGEALEPGASRELVDKWSTPPGFEGSVARDPPRKVGYRSMCRLYSGRLQALPFLQRFTFYMRTYSLRPRAGKISAISIFE